MENRQWLELIYRVVIGAACFFFGWCSPLGTDSGCPGGNCPKQPPPEKVQPDDDVRQIMDAIKRLLEKQPPPPPPAAPPPATPPRSFDAKAATVRISGCTGTILRGKRGYYVLTANHCVGRSGWNKARLKDGRQFDIRIAGVDRLADLAVYELKTDEKLPIAKVAQAKPERGTRVWHMGYGVHIPGNYEEGYVTRIAGADCMMYLSVSSGDSGSGIFRVDTNELISVVSRTTSLNRPGEMTGGQVENILALLRRVDEGGGNAPAPPPGRRG